MSTQCPGSRSSPRYSAPSEAGPAPARSLLGIWCKARLGSKSRVSPLVRPQTAPSGSRAEPAGATGHRHGRGGQRQPAWQCSGELRGLAGFGTGPQGRQSGGVGWRCGTRCPKPTLPPQRFPRPWLCLAHRLLGPGERGTGSRDGWALVPGVLQPRRRTRWRGQSRFPNPQHRPRRGARTRRAFSWFGFKAPFTPQTCRGVKYTSLPPPPRLGFSAPA